MGLALLWKRILWILYHIYRLKKEKEKKNPRIFLRNANFASSNEWQKYAVLE